MWSLLSRANLLLLSHALEHSEILFATLSFIFHAFPLCVSNLPRELTVWLRCFPSTFPSTALAPDVCMVELKYTSTGYSLVLMSSQPRLRRTSAQFHFAKKSSTANTFPFPNHVLSSHQFVPCASSLGGLTWCWRMDVFYFDAQKGHSEKAWYVKKVPNPILFFPFFQI